MMPPDGFVTVQLVVSGALVVMQLSTIPVFLVYAELRRRILYRIMLSIALSDFLQLFAIFQFTLYQFTGWEYSKWTEKLASGAYIVAWDHLIIQHFLLAMNRLIIIVRAYYSPTSYKQESRLENGVFNFLLFISWLLLAILMAFFMTPYCGGLWDPSAVGFYYELGLECSDVYRDSELYFTIAFPAVSIGCYLAIIGIMRKTRNIGNKQHQGKGSPTSTNTTNTGHLHGGTTGRPHHPPQSSQSLNGQEKRILVISVLLFSVITALIFAWYINYKTPPWTMLFCGYLLTNSSLTLSMNSEYRQRFVHMWRTMLHPVVPCLVGKAHKNRVTELNGQQQQKTLVMNSGAGGGAGAAGTSTLFIRRNEAQQREQKERTTGPSRKY